MKSEAQAATAAYIDGLGQEALVKAANYTNGNHWLTPLGHVAAN
jgi:hypothetical protein